MSRLSNDQLKSRALPYSTCDKDDCTGVTRPLPEATFGGQAGDKPNERKKKAVRIPLQNKTSHVSVLLRWHATGDELTLDARSSSSAVTNRSSSAATTTGQPACS